MPITVKVIGGRNHVYIKLYYGSRKVRNIVVTTVIRPGIKLVYDGVTSTN